MEEQNLKGIPKGTVWTYVSNQLPPHKYGRESLYLIQVQKRRKKQTKASSRWVFDKFQGYRISILDVGRAKVEQTEGAFT